MKRRDLLAHLQCHGCAFVREGGSHSLWCNPYNGKATAVPRHRTIKKFLARKICEQLGIPKP